MTVFSQIHYKTYQTELSLCNLGPAPGVGLGVMEVKNFWDLRWSPLTRGSSYIMHIRLNTHGVQVYKRNPYPWSLQISTL